VIIDASTAERARPRGRRRDAEALGVFVEGNLRDAADNTLTWA